MSSRACKQGNAQRLGSHARHSSPFQEAHGDKIWDNLNIEKNDYDRNTLNTHTKTNRHTHTHTRKIPESIASDMCTHRKKKGKLYFTKEYQLLDVEGKREIIGLHPSVYSLPSLWMLTGEEDSCRVLKCPWADYL